MVVRERRRKTSRKTRYNNTRRRVERQSKHVKKRQTKHRRKTNKLNRKRGKRSYKKYNRERIIQDGGSCARKSNSRKSGRSAPVVPVPPTTPPPPESTPEPEPEIELSYLGDTTKDSKIKSKIKEEAEKMISNDKVYDSINDINDKLVNDIFFYYGPGPPKWREEYAKIHAAKKAEKKKAKADFNEHIHYSLLEHRRELLRSKPPPSRAGADGRRRSRNSNSKRMGVGI